MRPFGLFSKLNSASLAALGAATLALSALTTPNVLAQDRGNEGSGGGKGTYSPETGRAVLADPYRTRSGVLTKLEPRLVEELKFIQWVVRPYARGIYSRLPEFFHDGILRSSIEYRFVSEKEMNQILAAHPGCTESTQLKRKMPLFDIGCTEGDVTWLLASRFKEMDLLEQALTVIHERMHTYLRHLIRDHADIAEITSGMALLTKTYRRQVADERVVWNSEELASIDLFRRRGEILRLADNDPNIEILNTGGQVSREVPRSFYENSYVGVASLVRPTKDASPLGEGSVILGSDSFECKVQKNAKLIASQCTGGSIGERTTLQNSEIRHSEIGAHVNILGSTVKNSTIGDHAEVTASEIENFEAGLSSQIVRSFYFSPEWHPDQTRAVLGPNAKLIDTSSEGVTIRLKTGAQLVNVKLSLEHHFRENHFAIRGDARLELEEDAILKNVKRLTIGKRFRIHKFRFGVGRLIVGRMILSRGTEIDYQGREFCPATPGKPQGALHVRAHFGGSRFSSAQEIEAACKDEREYHPSLD